MNLFIPLMFTPGPMEIILLLLVVVLLFGGRKIPELMKGLGQGMKEFKKATKEEKKSDDAEQEKVES
ncbi:MAG: twin-arginine translocase TatA/TatE family subunit [Bacteroidales bacterium]|nr:twin-arginine translocase TatA/TatE family subunit [Bacteroidales bacterium]